MRIVPVVMPEIVLSVMPL